ncbi:MAG: TfoX/Sxy family protein [Spirochaetes bacterium]|nr:TfoX/Sxy family protein [Spirochaetota bacterium]
MAYDEMLDMKISAIVEKWNMVRKKMFGGTCHLLDGKMVCGVYKDSLILRIGTEAAATALSSGKARVFDITGKVMKGWITIAGGELGISEIEAWIGTAKRFVEGLK